MSDAVIGNAEGPGSPAFGRLRHPLGPHLAPIPAGAEDVLAQSERGVLQLRAAFAVPDRRRRDPARQPERPNKLIPAIAGMSVMSTTFTALAYNIVFLRERGVLKRIRGTPLPTGSYFGGVAANAITNTALQIAIVVLAGRIFFGIGWPAHWGELIVFVVAGVVCFAALGVAFAHAIPNFESTAAYVNAVFLPVVFVSFYAFDTASAPALLRNIADALPLKPLIEGLSGAIVTGSSLGNNLGALAVIAGWGVVGCGWRCEGSSWEGRRG